MSINMIKKCIICTVENSRSWWKCCPKHTTEQGPDVVCEGCHDKLHPHEDDEVISQYSGISPEPLVTHRNIFDNSKGEYD